MPGANKVLSVKHYLWLICALTLFLVALFFTGNYPQIIEAYYSRGLYRLISMVWHLLLGWVPFSIGDVFYTAIIFLLLYFVWQFFYLAVHGQFKKSGVVALKFVISLQLFVAAFYLLWGMNYFRPPASQILNLPNSTYTLTELQTITTLLIDSANARKAALKTAEEQATNSSIYEVAVLAIKELAGEHEAFKSYYPAAKSSLFTPVINYLGTAGYFNPFSGEAQVNYAMPVVNRPVTACHEMAHQMGFAREDEANFIAFLAGIQSPDKLLRYSAYYLAMQELMYQVKRRDTVVFNQLKTRIAAGVKNDIKADRLYWLHYQNQIGYISSLFYDRFLKANNQPEGLRTYNRMIDLTLAYYRRHKPGQQTKVPTGS